MFQCYIDDNMSENGAFVLKKQRQFVRKEGPFADFVLIFYDILLCSVEKK